MDNANGYTPSSITESNDPLSLNKFVVIDEDDIFRYAAEETTAFRFIESFLQMDILIQLARVLTIDRFRQDMRTIYISICRGGNNCIPIYRIVSTVYANHV